MFYEVLWYGNEEYEGVEFQEFKSRKQAIKFYEEHKSDKDKFYLWVTKRNKDGEVVEDLYY